MMKIFLAGDSTVAHYSTERRPMAGWGEGLEIQLQEHHPDVTLKNFSKGGATTKSFFEEGLWDNLLKEVQKDDLVIIQFGHNDQKVTAGVTANDYYCNLKQMVADVREREGEPILCTPVERRQVVDGVFEKTLAREQRAMIRLAREEKVYLIDLNEYSYLYFQYNSTPEKTREYFSWFGNGESDYYPAGSQDDTHLSVTGASEMGRFVYLRLRPYLQKERMFDDYYYGACMYPEVFSEEIVKADIKHMTEIGMNFARIGEFIWSTLEPEKDAYDFKFLENVIQWYQEAGIKLVLCIPTPTPPIWLTKDHPERCIHNIDGTVMSHGSRQHVCTNNPYFRDRSYKLTKKIAELADRYENIIGIQLDNEFKCHVDLCYCDTCRSRWTVWLEQEYGYIDNLNKKWGTRIWSEEYLSFDEIPVPTATPFLHHASLMNAFRRFTAETLNEFAAGLCHMIRMETSLPITHNSAMGFNLANEELFHELDFTGFDTYAPSANHPAYTINLDLWRNMKQNVDEFMLLETSTSHAGHIENYISPHPDKYLVTEVFSGFAAGLTAFTYWHFRGHRFGVEQPHSTVVTPWGEPGSGYEDVVESGKLIQKMKPHLAATEHKNASIGFIYSDEAKRFYNTESGGKYDYRGLITDYYGSLIRKGLSLEVIQETENFTPFKLLIMPFIRHISPATLAKVQDFVDKGGKVIFGPMTGDRTIELAQHNTNGLGELGEWLDISRVLQISMHDQYFLGTDGTASDPLDRMITLFKPANNWEVLLKTEDDRVFSAKGSVGKGEAVYLGALPREVNTSELWDAFVDKEIRPYDQDQELITVEGDLVKYRRESDTTIQFYVVNMTKETQTYQLKKDARDVFAEQDVATGDFTIDSYEYKILEISK